MPTFLRQDAIRLFEAGVGALNLSLIGLGIPRQGPPARVQTSRYAAELGLLGVAAELAISAAYVQAAGPGALRTSDTQYKTARQVLDDFRSLLATPPPSLDFLTKGVADPAVHRAALAGYCRRLRLVTTQRAGAVHDGRGLSRDVCLSIARQVSSLYQLLARSERIRPYVSNVPVPPETIVEPVVLVEDLRAQLDAAKDVRTQAGILASLFLVLPEVPEIMPDWLDAFDRATVAPKRNDVALLLKTMEAAIPASLRRTKRSGGAIPVVISPGDPNALPIELQYLRTEFTRTPDRFYADVGNANGRLKDGILDCPPSDFVKELFYVGLEEAGLTIPSEGLGPHEAWPFVAASLAVQGTPGPFWFLVRRCSDISQLRTQLERAGEIGPPALRTNLRACEDGIESLLANRPARRTGLLGALAREVELSTSRRDALVRAVQKAHGTKRELPADLAGAIEAVATEGAPLGPVLLHILEQATTLGQETLTYWPRILCEAAFQEEDVAAVLAVQRSKACKAANTEARKAIRRIDYFRFGPPLE